MPLLLQNLLIDTILQYQFLQYFIYFSRIGANQFLETGLN